MQATDSFRQDSARSSAGRSDAARTSSPALVVDDNEIEEEAPQQAVSESHPPTSMVTFAPLTPSEVPQRIAAALTASTRAEANLRALFRTVKFLEVSVTAARDTNESLLKELRSLHAAIGEGNHSRASEFEPDATLLARAVLLEEALQETTEQAVREREFLIGEHDAFIASLVADHEKELRTLRRRVNDAEARLAAREVQDFEQGWDDDSRS